jgi:general secretion pathway protein D
MRALITFALVLLLAAPARSEGLVLNFREAEIGAIVAAVAHATGQRFIHDSELRGRVTIILEDEISPDEALEVLNAALLLIGYATIPAPDGAWKILPIEAARGAAPWLHGPESSDAERLVTTFVRLEAANPDEIARILGGEARASIVLPYPRTNSLIIAAAEDRLAQMLVLVRALDQATAVQLRVFPLRYADATAVAGQLNEVFQPGSAPGPPWKIVIDARTNSLVVKGAPARLAEVRDFIELLDVPSRSASGFHVVRVVNAEAETLASHLQGLDFGADRPGAQVSERIDVVTDEATNSLVIRAAPAAFAEIARVIGELDRIPQRVGIEVYVWDVETAKSLSLGFDALIPIVIPDDPNDTVAFATIGNVGSLLTPATTTPFLARFTRRPLVIPIIGPDGNPTTAIVPAGAAQITAAQGDVTIRAITRPYLLATAGEEQRIFSGDQVPIPVTDNAAATSNSGTGGVGATRRNPLLTSLAIQREDVGVELRVKPIAVSDELVSLELHVEVTSVAKALTAFDEAQSSAPDQGPTLRKFNLDANVRLTNGAVMLVAAAPADTTGSGETGVPFLKDIPILGWFFRSTRDVERRRRVVVAVQVNQIHSPEEQRAETIARRLAFERQVTRTDPLRALTGAPYAVLVATRAAKSDADQVVAELAGLAGTPAIVPWTDDDSTRYDVYLLGFEQISELGPLTVELRARGFRTLLEVVGPPRS